MNPLFWLAATAATEETSRVFFYENWFFVKPFIWLFGQIMSGIMWLLDQMSVYDIALCIVLFTVVTKMLLLPFTIKQQRSTRMQAIIQPELNAIQKKYAGKTDQVSRQKMMEEQQAVQMKYGISIYAGCLPSLLQMPVLFALYPVVYSMQDATSKYVGHYNALKDKITPEQWDNMWMLLGINLREAPGWRLTLALVIPILVMISQVLQTKLMTSRQQRSQSGEAMPSMNTMNTILPLMMGFFAVTFPAFLGWYWLVQSIVMAVQQFLINKQLDKKSNEELIKENIEKANKKRAKKGLPPISDKATISTRQINVASDNRPAAAPSSKKPDFSGLSEEEKEAMVKESTEYYASKAAVPGSLAAKANMVRDYNERNKK